MNRPVLLFLCGMLLTSGCYTNYNLATRSEELSFTSLEREIRMGRAIAEQVVKKLKVVDDAAMRERVKAIGARVAAASDRQDLAYQFDVVDAKEANAFSVPGGYVFVNRGLVEQVGSDDELAGVLAHEVAHIAARHAVKRYETALGYSVVRVLVGSQTRDAQFNRGLDLAFGQLFLAYARGDEFLADRLAVRYLQRAGYDPQGIVTFLERLRTIERKEPPRPKTYSRTHPYIAQRLALIRQIMTGQVGFDDYLNRESDLPTIQ